MSEPLLGVALFVGVILSLVSLILLARRVLLPTGVAQLRINDRRTIEVALGEKLLDGLGAAGIALPSACGGKGTCGQCRVSLLGEAPPPLPTESAKLLPGELSAGERLACQLTVRADLAIRIPDEVFGVRSWVCRVRSTRNVGTMIREIVAELPDDERIEFGAGSFVQVTAPAYQLRFADFEIEPEYRPEWDRLRLWRYQAESSAPATRAYSLANPPAEDRAAVLLVRLATPPATAPEDTPPGIVSSYLFGLRPGDELRVSGPYGHFFASESEREMIFVGGGAGMAPLHSHILDQLLRLKTRRRISLWYGARNRQELFYRETFDRLEREHENFRWIPALSEPRSGDWDGEVGFIHEVLERCYLAEHPSPEACEYYLCGPPLMAQATQAMLARKGVPAGQIHFDDFGA